jgi:hypothetical protein
MTMRDDPSKTLKWLEQELLSAEERPQVAPKPGEILYEEPDDLLQRVDALLADDPEIPVFVSKQKNTKASRAAASRVQTVPGFDESAAIPVKTKKQLKEEARRAKAARKKAGVNRNIKGLILLAALELLGILAIIGWWLQWLI